MQKYRSFIDLSIYLAFTLLNNLQCKVLKLADKPSCLGGGEKRTNAR